MGLLLVLESNIELQRYEIFSELGASYNKERSEETRTTRPVRAMQEKVRDETQLLFPFSLLVLSVCTCKTES